MMTTDLGRDLQDKDVTRPERPRSFPHRLQASRGEEGYTLVALMALMTILMLFAMAAAPSVNQQAQRERETEAIFRGEEVAEAIRLYYIYRGHQGVASLPTSMDQLLEGVAVPGRTNKIQVLRPEAAHDPLSKSAEWRLVRPNSQDLISFEKAVALFAGGTVPRSHDAFVAGLQNQVAPQIVNIIGIGSSDASTTTEPEGIGTVSAFSADNVSGPFVGVASESKTKSVITYYGIEQHDQWVFTPLFR
jgi:type II secretory pathway pseudopilin PulG